jgi:hypothetical protein
VCPGLSARYTKSCVDDRLCQRGGFDAGGVIDHACLTRIERDRNALHARQGSQHVLHAVDAATASHAGNRKLEGVHAEPRKWIRGRILLRRTLFFTGAFAQRFFGMVDQAIGHHFGIDGKGAVCERSLDRLDLACISNID